jgi:hypothetical protein
VTNHDQRQMGNNMPANESPYFVTPREAAEILCLSPGTLANWRMHRKYLRYCRIGSRIRYRLGDITAFALRRTRAANPEHEFDVIDLSSSRRNSANHREWRD